MDGALCNPGTSSSPSGPLWSSYGDQRCKNGCLEARKSPSLRCEGSKGDTVTCCLKMAVCDVALHSFDMQVSPAYPKLIESGERQSVSPNHSLSTSGSEESSSVGSGPISSLSQTIMAQIAEKERKGGFDSFPNQRQEPRSSDSNLG